MNAIQEARDAIAQTRDELVNTGALIREATGELNRRQSRIDALTAVLRAIVYEYDQTYDGDQDADGNWTAAAHIPVEIMQRAQALLLQE